MSENIIKPASDRCSICGEVTTISDKILVICQSYYKSTIIKKLLPWEELGYKLLLGLNSYYGPAAIRQIDPRVLLVVDFVPGSGVNTMMNVYHSVSEKTKVILVPYEKEPVTDSFPEPISVVPWNELTPEVMRRLLESVPSETDAVLPEPDLNAQPFLDRLEAAMRVLPYSRAMMVRVVMQNGHPNAEEMVESHLVRAVNKVGSGYFIREDESHYIVLLGLPLIVSDEYFRTIMEVLGELQEALVRTSRGHVVLFSSDIVPVLGAAQEYKSIVSKEHHAFFFADHPVLSMSYINRHVVDQAFQLENLQAIYVPLLKAALAGEKDRVQTLMEDIYMRQIKESRSLTYFRLIQTQMRAVYACYCFIKKPEQPPIPVPDRNYWCVEDAMESQMERFGGGADTAAEISFGPLVSEALESMIRSHGESVFASTIADGLGVSEAHLSRVFKRSLGVGITETIRFIRIYCASVDLLDKSISIKTVAARHGFNDPKYFNKVFHQLMGASPSNWRKQQFSTEEERICAEED